MGSIGTITRELGSVTPLGGWLSPTKTSSMGATGEPGAFSPQLIPTGLPGGEEPELICP